MSASKLIQTYESDTEKLFEMIIFEVCNLENTTRNISQLPEM